MQTRSSAARNKGSSAETEKQAESPRAENKDSSNDPTAHPERVVVVQVKLCHSCYEPCAPNRKMCPAHLEFHRKLSEKRRLTRREQGICYQCSEPVRPGAALCQKHIDISREQRYKRNAINFNDQKRKIKARNKRIYLERKAKHICTDCSQPLPPEDPRMYCENCREKRKCKYRERRARLGKAYTKDRVGKYQRQLASSEAEGGQATLEDTDIDSQSGASSLEIEDTDDEGTITTPLHVPNKLAVDEMATHHTGIYPELRRMNISFLCD
ncbi:hypothetical protein F5Y13DRAFT_196955 [Hypoxylon sp. FL1857]|nr:hypothetical protein F5Y13DRAFT_196955 [Hypoxylon sp. FL1857]